MKKYVGFAVFLVLLGAALYGLLRLDRLYGPIILAISLLPIGATLLAGFHLKRLIPDIAIGFFDAGLLTLAAVVGASSFGIVGAVIAAVIGDSLIDMIISTIDEPLKRWYRKRHIEEVRSRFGHSYAKMIGCFIGSGFVLTVAGLVEISPWEVLRRG